MSQVVKLKRFVLVEASLLLVVTLAAILKPPAVETVIKRDVVTITKEVKVPVERQVVLGAVESLIDNPVIQVIATAYDLSYDSCNKARTDRAFGITSRGVNLKGKDWRTARVIAVDPKVIPLDSKVRVTFLDPKYAKYNGIYLAADTGGKINGNHIDVFIEDTGDSSVSKEAQNFGVAKAYVQIIKE